MTPSAWHSQGGQASQMVAQGPYSKSSSEQNGTTWSFATQSWKSPNIMSVILFGQTVTQNQEEITWKELATMLYYHYKCTKETLYPLTC